MSKKRFQKVYIEITNLCNLHCSFCPKTGRPAKMMTLPEFNRILSEIRPYTDYICLHVKGEPLSHPEFDAFLDAAFRSHFSVNLTTNGTLLKKHADALTGPASPRQISLSLHSFDANGNGMGDFRSYLEDCIAFSKLFTARTPGFISYRLWNLEDDAAKDQYDRNRMILKTLEEAYSLPYTIESRTGKYTGNEIAPHVYVNFDHLFEWPDPEAPDFGERGTCYGLRRQLAILSDGTVIPCCLDGEGRIPLGNIHTESLSGILAKEKSLRIAEGFKENRITDPLCRRCGYRTRF